jgi:hypothetical protein
MLMNFYFVSIYNNFWGNFWTWEIIHIHTRM